jgi:hypothetical protein
VPPCPRCQSSCEEGQRYCSQCGAPLGDEAPAASPLPAAARSSSAPPWAVGLLIGAGVIIVILLILLLRRSAPVAFPVPGPVPQAQVPTMPAPTAAPTPPAPDLKQQVQGLLALMREAHLKKDINQYLSCYSPAFPDLERKRQDTLRAWENFDFINAFFTIDNFQPLDGDTVNATVTWNLDTKNKRTQKSVSAQQTYRVQFGREMDAWRIRALEEVR